MSEKLAKLRELMQEYDVKAYIVYHNDAHKCEYIAAHDGRVEFISGFGGSAGTCLVTMTSAYLYTDSRYWIAAEKELEEGWELKKSGYEHSFWVEACKQLSKGDKIGFDPALIPALEWRVRNEYFSQVGLQWVAVEDNLVDKVWAEDQPPVPDNRVEIHDLKWAGKSIT